MRISGSVYNCQEMNKGKYYTYRSEKDDLGVINYNYLPLQETSSEPVFRSSLSNEGSKFKAFNWLFCKLTES